jgi:hypothetical protein
LGSIYVSDGSGKYYSMSIADVYRGTDLVDFEKINSLEGVFISNRYEAKSGITNKAGSTKVKESFTQSDIQASNIQKARMNQGAKGNLNKKQVETQLSTQRDASVLKKEVDSNIKTYITHNKGGKWELISAPAVNSDGKKLNCYVDEGCSLHLQIYSHDGVFAPPYSQDSAVGLILAVGNLGERLDRQLTDRISTYLSRDGGLNWSEIHKGPYIYEIGDHGGLIVLAKHGVPTN